MQFLELAKARYSCRKFSNRPVEQELVDKIIDAAILAPTAINTQSFKLFVMASDEAKENLKKTTRYTFGAQNFIVLGAQNDGSWTRSFDKQNFSDVDAAIVGTHIMMEISDLGLATTWVGYFDAPKLKAMYPQMQNYDLIALFPFGYAAEDAVPASGHETRKTREELVEIL